jgi:signal peptidase II
MTHRSAAVTALLVAVTSFVLDRLTKWLVVEHWDLRNLHYIELGPFVNFTMAWNQGVNFGLLAFESMRWILVVFAVVVSIVVLIWAARVGRRLFAICAGLLAGGAVGNAWDRVVDGAVADFLNVTCCGFYNPYAFNVADVTIFMGAIGMVFIGTGPEKKTA